MANSKKRITLIDGNSLMFRAYYASAYTGKLMQNKDGLYTNAVFSFVNMIDILIRDEDYVFVAFDAGSQTFRHQEFEEYKGTRKPLPEELKVQIPYVKKYLDIMNVKRMESLEFEADDYLASVAEKAYSEFDEIRIVTGDRDLLQLVNDKIKVCLTKKGVGDLDEYTYTNFYEKMGYYPTQVTDYKGLVGDSSDNLPGIKGIGDKTAIKLLNEYSSLENIIENVDSLKGKLQTQISENQEVGLKCKRLATLKRDIDLDFSVEDLKSEEYNVAELTKFYTELEFYSFLKIMKTKPSDEVLRNVLIISDVNANVTEYLKENSYINIEVFKSNYYTGEFLGLSIVNSNHKAFFTAEVVLNNKYLKDYLRSNNYSKKTYDFKMLYHVLKKNGIEINNVELDLLLAAYLINPSYASDDFKKTVDKFSPSAITYYDNIYGANTKMKIPSPEIYANYSIDKCLIIKDLEEEMWRSLKENDLLELYNIELNLSIVLADMELNGLKIDIEMLDNVGKEFVSRADEIAQDIYFIAGEEFNINSPKKLGEILFENLKLPHGKKNKTGYSTNVDVLERLAVDYRIASQVLEYRAYTKLITTYVAGLKDSVDSDVFIHPLYRQANTVTGRLSSIEPNIQNMPIRSEKGQVIREIFISRYPNGQIISADYSQIELRILAHLSGDEKMIKAFNGHVDFHTQTASVMYEKPFEEVTKDMRRTAKAINFGIIYGMSAWGLSETLNISPLEANIYINKYFDTYKSVKTYLDSLVENVKIDGYTKTIYNRRRYIPEAISSNANLRSFGERTAMNAPMQGSAADIIKVAMNRIHDRLLKENKKTLLIAQVHDELLLDCPLEEVEDMKVLIKEEMENVIKLKVPLIVEVASGDNWFTAK